MLHTCPDPPAPGAGRGPAYAYCTPSSRLSVIVAIFLLFPFFLLCLPLVSFVTKVIDTEVTFSHFLLSPDHFKKLPSQFDYTSLAILKEEKRGALSAPLCRSQASGMYSPSPCPQ